MNGYTPTIPLVTRLYNLIEQIPQEYRARAIEECRASAAAEVENSNDYDTERHLIAYVAARKWELYPSPIDEAEIFTDGWCDPRTPAERAADEDWQNQQSDRADLLAGLHW